MKITAGIGNPRRVPTVQESAGLKGSPYITPEIASALRPVRALAVRGESLASHRDGRGAPGSPTRQPRWGPRPAGKARRPRTGVPAARGLRGGVAIPAVFEGGATRPPPGSPTRQPRWGAAGMHRPSNGVPSAAAALGTPNAARLSPRAAKISAPQSAGAPLPSRFCPPGTRPGRIRGDE